VAGQRRGHGDALGRHEGRTQRRQDAGTTLKAHTHISHTKRTNTHILYIYIIYNILYIYICHMAFCVVSTQPPILLMRHLNPVFTFFVFACLFCI
jgi:hypothetical protein